MRFWKHHLKCFICLALLSGAISAWSQDTTRTSEQADIKAWKVDVSSLENYFSGVILTNWTFPRFINYIEHSPDKKDYRRYRWHKKLITQQPTKRNHGLYYSLACSLWELNKIAEAEKMFLTIIDSQNDFYTDTYYHSSDIPGDTTKNIYGYGSYTSNYKNYAAIYLTRIYIEQNEFEKALRYLEDAVHKYKVIYTCGTGHSWQKREYDFLYASCYQGLKKYKEIFDLLLPDCLKGGDTFIVNAIRNLYTQKEIEENLIKAEQSLEFFIDTIPNMEVQTRYNSDTKKEITDTVKVWYGRANIVLFNTKVDLEVRGSEEGNMMTKEKLMANFKTSYFYKELLNIKEEENQLINP